MSVNELLFQAAAGIFAITGVLAAARQNMDVMSFMLIGIVAALGGGTMRDITLGTGVFWLRDTTYLYVAAAAAVAAFFFEQRFRATYNAFLYLDAVATAIFSVVAATRTLAVGFDPGVALVMGVLTGIGGGVLRDILTGQPSLLTRRELFMTPILAGVLLDVGSWRFAPEHGQVLAGLSILVVVVVRASAIRFKLAFPDWLTYRPLKSGA